MEQHNIELQHEVKQYVHSTGRWYKFFAVISIIGCATMALSGLLFLVAGDFMSQALSESGYDFPGWTLGLFYIVTAALMIPAIIFMFRASNAARTAVALNSNEAAVRFMKYTKSYWKYSGILSITILSLCVVIFIVAFIVGISMAF